MYTLEFLSINLAKTFHWLDADEKKKKRISSIVCVCVMLLISCLFLSFSFVFASPFEMRRCAHVHIYDFSSKRHCISFRFRVCVMFVCLFFFHWVNPEKRERTCWSREITQMFVWCLFWCFLFLLFFWFSFSFHQEKKINFRERKRVRKRKFSFEEINAIKNDDSYSLLWYCSKLNPRVDLHQVRI